MTLPQLEKFVQSVNTIRGCKTPNCAGALVPVAVKSRGLGGALSITFTCNGCASQWALFDTCAKYQLRSGYVSDISVCVQVAFLIAGNTHATYYKTLQHALGIKAVGMRTFLHTIERMHPVVKAMLDALCEAAKQDMKDKKEDELGSWKRAVTTADGTWQTRGWHSKNATFTIRNYLNGALLYYHHLCQKGSDKVIQQPLYGGTSKGAEGHAARITFQVAKEEGMQIAVHWQDADSSSAKVVNDIFPNAQIMICGGHAGRAHKKILEKRQKIKAFTNYQITKYKDTFPAVVREGWQKCKCQGNHSAGCGCLSDAFIAKAHTNFTSILMEAQSQEEFVRRLMALPKHARDEHQWDGGQCDFHPLYTCSCGTCENTDQLACKGKKYETRMKLTCKFHALVYEIECHERAGQAGKLIHPILKRGHSNACEASHNVLIRFRSKAIALERLHYTLSTNLGLLQANLTYMHAKLGTSYHWIPELYQRMQLPVFEGVVEALERHNVKRKKDLDRIKTTPVKKRRIELKKRRVREGFERSKWSRKHGRDTYGDDNDAASELEEDTSSKRGTQGKRKPTGSKQDKGKPRARKPCSACGSSTHQRSSHKDCPFNQRKGTVVKGAFKSVMSVLEKTPESDLDSTSAIAVSDVDSVQDASSDMFVSGSDTEFDDMCTCDGRAHKRDCPMSSRQRYREHAPASPPNMSHNTALSSARGDELELASATSDKITVHVPPSKMRKLPMKVGDYVCVHSSTLATSHVPCRIVGICDGRYQLYCAKGVINTSFSCTEVTPLTSCASIPLDKWRQSPRVSLRSVASNPEVTEHCECAAPLCSESIVISSGAEDGAMVRDVWINNYVYSLTHDERELIVCPTGWLTDKIIAAAQMLMLQHFPHMAGLQPPTLQKVFAFQVHSGEFVQIIHVRHNHWCVVSTVDCVSGVVNVYDSLYKSVSAITIRLIATMVCSTASKLCIRMMDVEKQSNGSDCGVLAIAYAFDLCSGLNPCTVQFDPKRIRHHLVTCLESGHCVRFPVLGERRSTPARSTKTVELHCTCRMPEEKGDEMAECDSCHVWYHRHCMDIPSDVFEGEADTHWECKACAAATTQ